ncbi:MAG: hypothetical protein WBD75_02175 [Phycisphaerae bacterium]
MAERVQAALVGAGGFTRRVVVPRTSRRSSGRRPGAGPAEAASPIRYFRP